LTVKTIEILKMDYHSLTNLLKRYETLLQPYGFELKPFLTGWYNDKLESDVHLPFPYDTTAISIISSPEMSERTFIPFLRRSDCRTLETTCDLLDESINLVFRQINDLISDEYLEEHGKRLNTITLRDYEMDNVTRQPKINVRTAGHVSSQARYYQRMDVPGDKDPWDEYQRVFGCSFHDIYGGWFAFRGVIVFPDIKYPSLEHSDPPDPLHGDSYLIIRLLNEFNFNWKTWEFRNVVPVRHRYSKAFMAYLSIPPGQARLDLVRKWLAILASHGDQGVDVIEDSCNDQVGLDWGM